MGPNMSMELEWKLELGLIIIIKTSLNQNPVLTLALVFKGPSFTLSTSQIEVLSVYASSKSTYHRV
jgi:hypothetical protein